MYCCYIGIRIVFRPEENRLIDQLLPLISRSLEYCRADRDLSRARFDPVLRKIPAVAAATAARQQCATTIGFL